MGFDTIIKKKALKGKACKIKTEIGTQGRVKFEEVTSNNNIWNITITTIDNNKGNSTSWG